MLKYVETKVTFSEIPDEITLCISISNCQNNCLGCHSSYLKEDIGTELTKEVLKDLISLNKGITCVCFMGEGYEPYKVVSLSKYIKENYSLKTAWYRGYNHIYIFEMCHFDYIKLGDYRKDLGGLEEKTTNQRIFKIENITYKFWKDDTKSDK